MKPKTMILMGLAITCGLGASYMTSQLLAERQPQAEEEKVAIFVAKNNLSVGQPIKKPEDLFEIKQVAKDQEPPDSIKELETLKGKILKRGLRKGDHVTPNDMFGDKDSLEIPEGHQAVGLRVSLESIASGFASLPLSRVNIIHTVRRGDDKTSYCQILLENVLVLAADLEIDRQKGIAAPAQIVTFALKEEEVLKVNLAKEMGILSLSLRKPADKSRSQTMRVNGEEITGGKKTEQEPATAEVVVPKKVAPPIVVQEETKPSVVTPKAVAEEQPKGTQQGLVIINGNQQSRTTFRVNETGEVMNEDNSETGPSVPRPLRNNSAPKKSEPSDVQ